MKKYFLIFIICWAIFLIHAFSIRHGVYGDGGGYYVYTQSLFFDKGLNFGPILNFMTHFQGVKGEFSRILWDTPYDPYPIGAGIIWIPAMAITSLFFHNRFSLVFELGPGLTGILCVIGGMYFLEKYLSNFFSKKVSSISVLFFFFASNLFYYSSFEPALAHQPVFFILSFLLYKTYKMKVSLGNYILVGALSGLLFITRVPDAVLLIPILYQLLKLKPKFKHIAVFCVSALLATLPMWWSYYIMMGNPFSMPYLTAGVKEWSFTFRDIFNFFFTAKRGLFTWTPIYFFAIIGLFKNKKYLFIITLTLLILICAFWASVSVAFGQRFILAGIPYFAFGIAVLIQKMNTKWIAASFIVLLTWNILTIFQFYFNKPEVIKNDNLTLSTFVKGQFESPTKALKLIKDKGFNYFFYRKVLY